MPCFLVYDLLVHISTEVKIEVDFTTCTVKQIHMIRTEDILGRQIPLPELDHGDEAQPKTKSDVVDKRSDVGVAGALTPVTNTDIACVSEGRQRP